jgi:Cu+-exporting ATPase
LQLALAAPVYLWCGWPIHAAALVRLRALGADMNTLVSLGTSVAFVSSLWLLLAGHAAHAGGMGQGGHALTFEAAAVIIVFVLLGRWLEAKSTARAGEALRALSAASVPTARVIVDGTEREVSAAEITAGMQPTAGNGTLVLAPRDGGAELVAGTIPVNPITWNCNAVGSAKGGTNGTLLAKYAPAECR